MKQTYKFNYKTRLTLNGDSVNMVTCCNEQIKLDEVVAHTLKQAISYLNSPLDQIEVEENGKLIYSGEDKWFDMLYNKK